MAAHDNLNPRQFKMSVTHFGGDSGQMVEAHTGNGRKLGVLTTKQGTVSTVTVKPKWQRQGMATQMFHKARELEPDLKHSANRTDAGNAWAKKVGGVLPERVQDHPEWGD